MAKGELLEQQTRYAATVAGTIKDLQREVQMRKSENSSLQKQMAKAARESGMNPLNVIHALNAQHISSDQFGRRGVLGG